MATLRRIRHRLSKSALRKPLVWARHRGLGRADGFIGSYPRSGSTWLRFQLVEILAGQATGFGNVNELIPDVGDHQNAVALLPDGGHLIKTHEPYRFSYKKAIYLVRDARDVVLSEFAYQKALGFAEDDFDKYLPRFLRGEVNPFGSWTAHVNSWMDAVDNGWTKTLVVRFEDLRHDPEKYLGRILDFLEVRVERARIREAVENNSLERMRDKERTAPQRASAKGRFIRSGTVGGWRESFTESQMRLLQESSAAAALARLGYPAVGLREKEFA